jgi:hypothetical protein
MQCKSFVGLLMVLSLVIFLLSPFGGLVMAGPPPLEGQMAALQPSTSHRDLALSDGIGAMASTILYPSDDAPVREGAPNSTAPNQLYLGVGYDDGYLYGTTGRIRSYLRFNLSGLSDSIIVSAKLNIYHAGGQDYSTQKRTTTFYRVTGNWNESGITWNNQPGYAEDVGNVSTAYDFQDWLEVDLTDLVRAWVSGDQLNYGLVAIGLESSVGVLRAFASSESTLSPELRVSYIPAPPPVLDVSPGSLLVRADSTEQLSLQVFNVTANSLNWTATKVGSAGWLSLDNSSGSVTPTSPDTLGLTISPGGQPPGTFTAQIRVSSSTPGVQGSPKTIDVTLEVFESLEQIYLPIVLKAGASPAPEATRIVAMVVGVGDYQQLPSATGSSDLPTGWGDNATDLPCPPCDRRDVSNYLLQELGISPEYLRQFSGGPGESVECAGVFAEPDIVEQSSLLATRANVIQGFAQLDSMEDRDSLVIFYYSGHGGQTPDGNGDESDGFDEFIAMYDTDLVSGQFVNILTDDDLNTLLANLESENIIVILDSCYSGGMLDVATTGVSGDLRRRGLGRPGGSGPNVSSSELTSMADLAGPGRVIITGATGDQSTWESSTLQNGVFTYFYLQALEDALNDANQNNRISAEEAFWFSRDLVDDWVYANMTEHQNPAISDEHFGQLDLTWLP